MASPDHKSTSYPVAFFGSRLFSSTNEVSIALQAMGGHVDIFLLLFVLICLGEVGVIVDGIILWLGVMFAAALVTIGKVWHHVLLGQ